MDWNDFRRRLGPGIVLGAVFAVLLLFSMFSCFGRLLLCFTAILMTAMTALECAQVFGATSPRNRGLFGLALVPAVAVCISFIKTGVCAPDTPLSLTSETFGTSVLFVVGVLFCAAIFAGLRERDRTQNWFATFFPAILFMSLGGGAFTALCTMPNGKELVIWVIIVSVLNDTAAYFVGGMRGGPALAPAISPGKTWSGSMGGLLFSIAGGLLTKALLPTSLSLMSVVIISAMVGVGGQVGDLIESYLKRSHGIKDFGSALGSHGGIFDRVDSHFGAAFALFIILEVLV